MLSIPQDETGRGKSKRTSLDVVYWTDVFSSKSSSAQNAKVKAIANLGKIKKHEDTIGIYSEPEKSRVHNIPQKPIGNGINGKRKGVNRSSSFLVNAKSLFTHFTLNRPQGEKQKQNQKQVTKVVTKRDSISRSKLISQYTQDIIRRISIESQSPISSNSAGSLASPQSGSASGSSAASGSSSEQGIKYTKYNYNQAKSSDYEYDYGYNYGYLYNSQYNLKCNYDESDINSGSCSSGSSRDNSHLLSPFGIDFSSESPSSSDSLSSNTCAHCGRSTRSNFHKSHSHCEHLTPLFSSFSVSTEYNLNMAPDVTGKSTGKSSGHHNNGNRKEDYFRVDHHGYVINRGQNIRRGPSAIHFSPANSSAAAKDFFNCKIPRPKLKNGGIVPTHSFGMTSNIRNQSPATLSFSSMSSSCHNLSVNSTPIQSQPTVKTPINPSTPGLPLLSTKHLFSPLENDSLSLSARVRRKGYTGNSHGNSLERCFDFTETNGGGREDSHQDSLQSTHTQTSTSPKVSPQNSACDRRDEKEYLTKCQTSIQNDVKILPPQTLKCVSKETRFWGGKKKSLIVNPCKGPNVGDGDTRRENDYIVEFLKTVPVFRKLSNSIVGKLGEHIVEASYDYGDYILFEGDEGDKFYIIFSGKVRVTTKCDEKYNERFIRKLYPGDFFGELALIGNNSTRTANVIADDKDGVVCFVLSGQVYEKYLMPVKEFRVRYIEQEFSAPVISQSQSRNRRKLNEDVEGIELDDLRIVTTLGVGGFGRVELVTLASDTSKSYALKQMKKSQIVATRQVEHIKSEKAIMFEANSEFICKLYKTFRDPQYLYMLMECCLGGELWTILRDRGYFDDSTTLFYAGCVLEALRYLHSRNIIYRDLKPENLLLDASGYVKLVDFGFAKKLQEKKTWTFCGTPEYVAPEVIMNKGHGLTADYWSFGVLLHELLTGSPPFQGGDPVKTYRIILKGMSCVEFPSTISKDAGNLIRKLCRDNPTERLGSQRGGIIDIQKHKWFDGFNWSGLRARSITPPILPEIKGPLDSGNFDHYECDMNGSPPIDISGWDEDF